MTVERFVRIMTYNEGKNRNEENDVFGTIEKLRGARSGWDDVTVKVCSDYEK